MFNNTLYIKIKLFYEISIGWGIVYYILYQRKNCYKILSLSLTRDVREYKYIEIYPRRLYRIRIWLPQWVWRMGIWICSRQKLTSPKWNRFKGIRLRWKDKIRLNNVIWRCWHMQCKRKKRILSAFRHSIYFKNKPRSSLRYLLIQMYCIIA